MSVPGMNLLAMASSVIRFQPAQWYKFRAEEDTGDGIVAATYFPPETVRASLQPVPRTLMVELGLDFNKDYIMAYVERPLSDVRRDKSPDMLTFIGRKWKVESSTDWTNQDGWQASICVDIGPAA